MILKNAVYYGGDFEKHIGDIQISDERIENVGGTYDGDETDCAGLTLMPGFVDIHIHGCNGADCADMTENSLEKMSVFLARHGVTGFCPTTMTESVEKLRGVFGFIAHNAKRVADARILGINMEGPYLSFAKRGSQAAAHLRDPHAEEFDALQEAAQGTIKLVTVAPENKYAADFIKAEKDRVVISVGHTDAEYETVEKAIQDGAAHSTHLFNAMKGISHRSPGTVGAVLDSAVTAELICDGLHIHPAVLRMAFEVLGEERSVIVSDAMSLAGMEEGEAMLGGQRVILKNGIACLENGTIAASTTNLLDEFKNVIKFGIPEKQAVKSVTINPAKVIGAQDEIGSIEKGKYADIIGFDKDYNLKLVIIHGKKM